MTMMTTKPIASPLEHAQGKNGYSIQGRTSSQSEAYSSKRLIWLGKPLVKQHVDAVRST